jgi:hypothetical protein
MTSLNRVRLAFIWLVLAVSAFAQNYRCDWYVVCGGGSSTSGSNLTASVSVAQTAIGNTSGTDFLVFLGFWQTGKDVACIRLVAPVGTVGEDSVVTPACSLFNYGSDAATYTVRMRIGVAYDSQITVVNHRSNTAEYRTFPVWLASPVGDYAVCCSTGLTGDAVPGNNAKRDSVHVVATGIAEEEPPLDLPRVTALRGSQPNPVRGFTQIAYDIATTCKTSISIFDVQGRIVRKLLDAVETPGRYRVPWDRRDGHGQRAPAGVYFCRMQAGGFKAVRKMPLVE